MGLELVAGNPNGSASSEVTVTLRNAKGEIVSLVSKAVPVDECDKVLFVFSEGWLVSHAGRGLQPRGAR